MVFIARAVLSIEVARVRSSLMEFRSRSLKYTVSIGELSVDAVSAVNVWKFVLFPGEPCTVIEPSLILMALTVSEKKSRSSPESISSSKASNSGAVMSGM